VPPERVRNSSKKRKETISKNAQNVTRVSRLLEDAKEEDAEKCADHSAQFLSALQLVTLNSINSVTLNHVNLQVE